jgi:hypothetical protein
MGRSMKNGRRARSVATLLTLVLVVAACGDDSGTGEATPTTTTTAAVDEPETAVNDTVPPTDDEELTASHRGISADTITLGVAIADVTPFAAVGDIAGSYRALAELQNEAGGIAGRQIELLVEEWLILDTTLFEEACIKLTEDEEVFAVLGFMPGGWGSQACYADIHETIVINTESITQDDIDRSSDRLMTTAADAATLLRDGLALAAEEIDGKNVAIYAGMNTAPRIPEFRDAIEALGGIVVNESEQLIGGEDITAAEAELDITVERWRDDGVEVLVSLDGSIAAALGALERADRTDMAVFYAGTVVETLTALGANPANFPNLLAVGPPVQTANYESGGAGVTECVDKVSAVKGKDVFVEGPDGLEDEIGITQRVCAAWDVMMAGLGAAGVNPTETSFLEGAYALGSFDATGFTSVELAPGRAFLGNVDPALYSFDLDTGAFVPVE